MKPPLILRLPAIAPGESALVPGMAAPLPQPPGPALPPQPPAAGRFRRGMVRTRISGAQSRRVAAFLMPDTSAGQPPTQQPSRWSYDLDPAGASRATFPGAVAAPNLPGAGNTTGTGNIVLQNNPAIIGATISGGTIAPALVQGVIDGSNAPAGKIGELLSATLPSGTPIALATNINRDIISLPLPAGDWQVWAIICAQSAGGGATQFHGWINTVSATAPAAPWPAWFSQNPLAAPGISSWNVPIGLVRLNLTAPATAFLSTLMTFPGTCNAYGAIFARRVA